MSFINNPYNAPRAHICFYRFSFPLVHDIERRLVTCVFTEKSHWSKDNQIVFYDIDLFMNCNK